MVIPIVVVVMVMGVYGRFLLFKYDYVSYDYVHAKLSSIGLEKYIGDIDPTIGKLGVAVIIIITTRILWL